MTSESSPAPCNASTALATVLVDELVRCGARDIVLAPGSRSAALAFAAHAAAADDRVRLHVRIDERSAGFLALGLARTSKRPVPVVTTSGTAVANLHPAVLEASHAGIPLLVLSADRPAGLRGTNANQTTDQVKIFGDAVRAFADLPPAHPGTAEPQQVASWRSLVARMVAVASGSTTHPRGPVHVNVQFTEPLVPDSSDGWTAACDGRADGRAWTTAAAPVPLSAAPLDPAPGRTVVVAGDDAGPPARVLAEQNGWPLLAEPTSGSRTGANAIRTYRLLLADPDLTDRIERVVVCGHPTLSRPVTRLLSRTDIEVVAVPTAVGWTDPGHAVTRVAGISAGSTGATRSTGSTGSGAWLREWQDRDAEVSAALDKLLAEQGELTPHHVAGALSSSLPPHGLLFVGASNPVRDLDLMVGTYPVGEHRLVVANRGLAGIDGSVSSAVGAALGRTSTSRAFALLGDVTFLHDANGLVIGPDELRPDLMLVVVNDDGGSIFASLEQGAPTYSDSYDKLFGTPHGVDLGALCRASHTPYRKATTPDELQAAIDSPVGGVEVVEAVVRRDNRRALDAAIRGLVTNG